MCIIDLSTLDFNCNSGDRVYPVVHPPKFGTVKRSMRPRLRIFDHPMGVRLPVTRQVTTLSIACGCWMQGGSLHLCTKIRFDLN